jgi:uncharacterized iron-regulated membrane protein
MKIEDQPQQKQPWLDYRAVWRWHFYAGLFCIPFVIWLSVTGSIYLFRPQVERWLDRHYEHLQITGPRASREAQIQTAISAVPGSKLHFYELPQTAESAIRVIVGRGKDEFRVYVHPQTLNVLKVVNEDKRPMTVVFHLHGELLSGDWGSRIVELAASWAIIMILSGIYLWWPRQADSIAGVLYPRLGQGKRIFWRDLHAVTGVWVSLLALFQLFTGLPWAKSWGDYLGGIRKVTRTEEIKRDWTNGSSSEIAARLAMNADTMASMAGMHASQMPQTGSDGQTLGSYAAIDRMVATVAPLRLPYPVLLSPPAGLGAPWTAKSGTQNRPLRVDLELDPATGNILKRVNFNQHHWIDRAVGFGVAAHEGQLFGLFNQLLGVFMATGLVLLSISAVVLWWSRRPESVLGAPPLPAKQSPISAGLKTLIAAFGVYLPLMGLSIILVLLTERFVLQRIPAARHWLGLRAAANLS